MVGMRAKGKRLEPARAPRSVVTKLTFAPGEVDFIEVLRKIRNGEVVEILDSGFGESKKPDYKGDMDRAAILEAAAELLSRVFPAANVGKVLEDLVANSARETAGRVNAESRPVIRVTLIEDQTLVRLRERYEARLKNTELPALDVATKEQVDAAGRLAKTFRDLRKRQSERKLEPEPSNNRVAQAESLVQAFYARYKKLAHPQRRRREGAPAPN
jgi:hypothetical protein